MNTEQPNPQPTILPWHREAATDIHETPLPTMSQYVNITECMEARIDRLSAIIARHDATNNEAEAAKAKKTAELFVDATGYPEELRTLKAQHAATLRLLEEAFEYVDEYAENKFLRDAIRAHLAAHSKPSAMQQSAKQEGRQ